ncbi:unnamed protein product [Malus baccata var. baccata]
MWKSESNISLRIYSQNHIDLEIGGLGDALHWRLTCFYGYPWETERYKSWRLLEQLNENASLPWCYIGDFNETLKADEQGEDLSSKRHMRSFRNAINVCQLIDLGYHGNKFTWETTRGGGIKVRLDRALATQEWINLFPKANVSYLKPTSSDHLLIFLDWEAKSTMKFKKAFRYE